MIANNRKALQVNFNGTQRILRFNNYTIEALVRNCAGGDYSLLEDALKKILAHSALLAAAHIVNAALSADDYLTDAASTHTFQQCKEWVGDIPYVQVIAIIEAFNNANEDPSPEPDAQQNGMEKKRETAKKKLRGKTS